MGLIKVFAENNESVLAKSRDELESLIKIFTNSKKQRENLLAELGRAEKIWQTPDPTMESSNFLW